MCGVCSFVRSCIALCLKGLYMVVGLQTELIGFERFLGRRERGWGGGRGRRL